MEERIPMVFPISPLNRNISCHNPGSGPGIRAASTSHNGNFNYCYYLSSPPHSWLAVVELHALVGPWILRERMNLSDVHLCHCSQQYQQLQHAPTYFIFVPSSNCKAIARNPIHSLKLPSRTFPCFCPSVWPFEVSEANKAWEIQRF